MLYLTLSSGSMGRAKQSGDPSCCSAVYQRTPPDYTPRISSRVWLWSRVVKNGPEKGCLHDAIRHHVDFAPPCPQSLQQGGYLAPCISPLVLALGELATTGPTLAHEAIIDEPAHPQFPQSLSLSLTRESGHRYFVARAFLDSRI